MSRRPLTAFVFLFAALLSVSDGTLAETRQAAEGIAVRGHWVLEVLNPDGTLSRRAEFDNALHHGAHMLVNLLSRNRSMGRWAIMLESERFPVDYPFGNQEAFIVEPHWPVAPTTRPDYFSNLQLTPASTNTFNDVASFQLSGTAKALHQGVITHVATRATLCNGNVVADSCFDGSALIFTSTRVPDSTPPEAPEGFSIPDGLMIQAGQLVQVQVTISFTSAPHPPTQ